MPFPAFLAFISYPSMRVWVLCSSIWRHSIGVDGKWDVYSMQKKTSRLLKCSRVYRAPTQTYSSSSTSPRSPTGEKINMSSSFYTVPPASESEGSVPAWNPTFNKAKIDSCQLPKHHCFSNLATWFGLWSNHPGWLEQAGHRQKWCTCFASRKEGHTSVAEKGATARTLDWALLTKKWRVIPAWLVWKVVGVSVPVWVRPLKPWCEKDPTPRDVAAFAMEVSCDLAKPAETATPLNKKPIYHIICCRCIQGSWLKLLATLLHSHRKRPDMATLHEATLGGPPLGQKVSLITGPCYKTRWAREPKRQTASRYPTQG